MDHFHVMAKKQHECALGAINKVEFSQATVSNLSSSGALTQHFHSPVPNSLRPSTRPQTGGWGPCSKVFLGDLGGGAQELHQSEVFVVVWHGSLFIVSLSVSGSVSKLLNLQLKPFFVTTDK